jgi:hypothetical protein
MNLFDVLSEDKRCLVVSFPERNSFVIWNWSLMLQEWKRISTNPFVDEWEEVQCHTLEEAPESFDDARVAAMQWIDSL